MGANVNRKLVAPLVERVKAKQAGMPVEPRGPAAGKGESQPDRPDMRQMFGSVRDQVAQRQTPPVMTNPMVGNPTPPVLTNPMIGNERAKLRLAQAMQQGMRR